MHFSRILMVLAIALSTLSGTIGVASAHDEGSSIAVETSHHLDMSEDCCATDERAHHNKCQGDVLALLSDSAHGGARLVHRHDASRALVGDIGFRSGLLDPPRG